jgi:deazaflavin-dependent oxidoreductase (nitroreductase family)
MTAQPPTREQWRAMNTYVVAEFRRNGGKLGGEFATSDLLLLTTIGANSGEPRLVPLSYFMIDGRLIVVGSNVGADFDPSWVLNLRATPKAQVELGTDAYDVSVREVPTAERAGLFEKVVAAAPRFGDYQAKTHRPIPLFELQRS